MQKVRMRQRHLSLLALILTVLLGLGAQGFGAQAASLSPQQQLQDALARAHAAGSYQVTIDLMQSLQTLATQSPGMSGDTAHFTIQGLVNGPQQARFRVAPRLTTLQFQAPEAEAEEILISGTEVYRRVDEQWVLTDKAPSSLEMSPDTLSIASAATNVQRLEAVERAAGRFERVQFTLRPVDVLRFLLAQRGALDAYNMAAAQMNGPGISGTGEMWISADGFPARLVLDLTMAAPQDEAHAARVVSTTDYAHFGQKQESTYFDPSASPTTGTPAPTATTEKWHNFLVNAFAGISVGLFLLLLAQARGNQRASAVVTTALVLALLAPTIAAAAGEPTPRQPAPTQPEPPPPGSEFQRMLEETQRYRIQRTVSPSNVSAPILAEMDDEDGDQLPNGYEIQLGTNPFLADSDRDGLDDHTEVTGKACTPTTGPTLTVETNPLSADSNADGVLDGAEFREGNCGKNGRPNAWNDDNDDDKVPDDLDLSPFSSTAIVGGGSDGADLTFHTLDENPDAAITEPYLYYVDLQIRPQKTESLRWAYKSLDWPSDLQGSIRTTYGEMRAGRMHFLTASGEMQIVPYLQATMRYKELPSEYARAAYNIQVTPVSDAPVLFPSPDDEYRVAIPLVPVERGGQVFAFQARVLHDWGPYLTNTQTSARQLTHRWRDLRLQWILKADVLRVEGEDQKPKASPSGGYGLVVYDEPFQITGLQASRQAGVSMLVAAAHPTNQPNFDDGPIALLRAGMEAQFLGGGLSLAQIKARFDASVAASATITERWGIPHSQMYQVRHDTSMNYAHLDQALATTMMTTTRQVLNQVYGSSLLLKPTLILASEQTISNVNLDDYPTADSGTITIDTCLKPLITTRSLKLQTYQYAFAFGGPISVDGATNAQLDPTQASGSWRALTLDEVLQKIEAEFRAQYQQEWDDAGEAALNIHKLATTAWYVGQTSIKNIEGIKINDISDIPQAIFDLDLELMAKFLVSAGVIPESYMEVVQQVLDVLEVGAEYWLDREINRPISYLPEPDGGGSADTPTVGSTLNLTPSFIPSSEEVLQWTSTAISVLTVAAWFDLPFAQELLDVATQIVDIFQKVRGLWDFIKATIDSIISGQGLAPVMEQLFAHFQSLAKPLSVVGGLIAIGQSLLFLVGFLSNGDVGPLVALAIVLRTVIEIVITVILMVLGSLGPVGMLISLVIGVVRAVEQWTGVKWDPISLILDYFFTPEVDMLTGPAASEASNPNPDISTVAFEPLEPLAGIVAGRNFRLNLEGRMMLNGPRNELYNSDAKLQIGTGYIGCVSFNNCWVALGSGQHWKGEPWELSTPYGYGSGTFTRSYSSRVSLEVRPYHPLINVPFGFYLQYYTKLRYRLCTPATGCDAPQTHEATTERQFSDPFYLDILPETLTELWNWNQIINHDPDGDGLDGYLDDGDGLEGYLDPSPPPYDPNGAAPVGPDANLCASQVNPSYKTWDWDADGLSDAFEVEHEAFDPCQKDTDNDGLLDNQELTLGTLTNDADTDNDGIPDYQELTHWGSGWSWTGSSLTAAWRLPLSSRYPGLPNPAVYPNLRYGSLDGDHRRDSHEKSHLTSPVSFNSVVGEPLILNLWSEVIPGGGGSRVQLRSIPWANTETSALTPTLVVTMPVAFDNLTRWARLRPSALGGPQFNNGSLAINTPPNVFRWALPPIWANRFVSATLTGIPLDVAGPVTVTAHLEYTEGPVRRVVSASAPLLVNTQGPTTTIESPLNAAILPSGPITVTGSAVDPDGDQGFTAGTAINRVYVCAKSTDTCATSDWQLATGGPNWHYQWTPPASGTYYLRAYAIDHYNLAGPVSAPVMVQVDATPAVGASFDQDGPIVLSTTLSVENEAFVQITGRISDTPNVPVVSGAGSAYVVVNDGDAQRVQPHTPGAPTSTFGYTLTVATGDLGRKVTARTQFYQLTVEGRDMAGNSGSVSDTLQLLVDDAAPSTAASLPQTADGANPVVTGLADDTQLFREVYWTDPLTGSTALATHDALWTTGGSGKAVVVGDLNGDLLDEVALVVGGGGLTPQPLRVGLFLGRSEGFPATLDLNAADVLFQGEVSGVHNLPPAVSSADLNGDGLDDLIVGDPLMHSGAGRVYVILGQRAADWPSPFNLADAAWRLDMAGATGFGSAVAAAGDTDGDGLEDFLAGAASDGSQPSVTWLYLGREQGTPPVQATLRASHCTGCPTSATPSLAGVGDTNGDGLADFLVGTHNAVSLVYGRPHAAWPATPVDLQTFADVRFAKAGTQQTVAAAGDVNGDQLADFLIGDPAGAPPRVFLFFGRRAEQAWDRPPFSVDAVTAADRSFIEEEWSNSRLGAEMAPLGDLDQDGHDDFAIGQPGSGNGPNRVIVVRAAAIQPGRDRPAYQGFQLITGTSNSQRLGTTLSAGDINGDTLPDLLAGAAGESRAYLFAGHFDPGVVAGIQRVEVGVVGPVVDHSLPPTATLPTSWQPTTLTAPGAARTPWRATLMLAGAGDYRIYARVVDGAGNVSPQAAWYQGSIWANPTPAQATSLALTLNEPALTNLTDLALNGTVANAQPIQSLRVFDGYQWHRLPPTLGTWEQESLIPISDLRTLVLRAVARDAFGTTQHVTRTLSLDTQVVPFEFGLSLPPDQWQTNTEHSLVITWPSLADGSGIVGVWAVIDSVSDTIPTTPAVGNQISQLLSPPGIYYAHVLIEDGVGNERLTHFGPFVFNDTHTPSLILPDGHLDFDSGEYPENTLLNHDPYAALNNVALWGTWDQTKFYLGYPGTPGASNSALMFYLDTKTGGLTHSLTPYSATHTLPFAADVALLLGPSAGPHGTLYTANAGTWQPVAAPVSYAVTEVDTEVVLDLAEIGATGPVQLLTYMEDPYGILAVMPSAARPSSTAVLTGTVAFGQGFNWPGGLVAAVAPNAGQTQMLNPIVQVHAAWEDRLVENTTTFFSVTVSNPDMVPYVNVPLDIQTDPKLQLQSISGGSCISCPVGSNQWQLAVNVAPGETQTVTLEGRTAVTALTGVFSLTVAAEVAHGNLPLAPQPAAQGNYTLDLDVGDLEILLPGTIYTQPGPVAIPFIPRAGMFVCSQRIQVNTGLGWQDVCSVGNCNIFQGIIPSVSPLAPTASESWQFRVVGDNGRISDPVTLEIVTDESAPTIHITSTQVLSGSLAFIQGWAEDDASSTRAPERVEVSLNGQPFAPTLVTTNGVTPTNHATWRLPITADNADGETLEVAARAIDEAGNSSATATHTFLVDGRGPLLAVTQRGASLQGQATDGSGVATVEISLDGGASYRLAQYTEQTWSFDPSTWEGTTLNFALIRATDIWGNVSTLADSTTTCAWADTNCSCGTVGVDDVVGTAEAWLNYATAGVLSAYHDVDASGNIPGVGDGDNDIIDIQLIADQFGAASCPLPNRD